MFRKFGLGVLAVVMAAAFSAFTAPKKANTSVRTQDLYWYVVDLQTDAIPQNASPYAHTDKDNAGFPCQVVGSDVDCIRGFINQLNTSNGPVTTPGDDSKMTDRQ